MKIAFVTVIALSLCLLLLLFASCASSGETLDEYKDMLDSISQSEAENERFADKVYVIISKDCSGELSLAARDLAQAISDKTGVDALVKYDNEDISVGKRDLTLLLGANKYVDSQEAIKPLRLGDYVCRWDDGALILGGRHDDATVEAIERFISDVIPGASSNALMPENASFENKNIYTFSQVTLNGFDLYDYTLVYPDGDVGEIKGYVEVFRDYIVDRSGYFLNMISEAKIDKRVGKTISFEKDAKMSGASIELDDNSIYVKAAGEYELGVVCAKIAEDLFLGTEGVSDATVTSCALDCGVRDLNFCRTFFDCPDEIDLDFVTEWSRMMHKGDHDLVVVGRIESWFLEFIEMEAVDYEMLMRTESNGDVYLVLYKKDVIDSIGIDVLENGFVINMKCIGESDERRLVCAANADKTIFEGLGEYDAVLTDAELKVDPSGYGMSVAGTASDESATFTLVAGSMLEFDGEMTLAKGDICCENLFVSFSYRPGDCSAFERLKN